MSLPMQLEESDAAPTVVVGGIQLTFALGNSDGSRL
jgi:hypothetical protein